jgi:phosphate transport system protein
MSRQILDSRIEELKIQISELELMVREATINSVSALLNNDTDLAKKVYKGDTKINEKRYEIERACLIVIATHQPLATDLRFLSSILEVITELERMGDYAKGIAKIHLMVGDRKLLSPLNGLEEMGKIATGMLSKSIVAFLAVDVETARKIPSEDDKVDALFNKIYRELINIMIDDPSSVEFANHLQWAVHNIERMADRVTNICERTIFIDTGLINEIEDEETHSFH